MAEIKGYLTHHDPSAPLDLFDIKDCYECIKAAALEKRSVIENNWMNNKELYTNYIDQIKMLDSSNTLAATLGSLKLLERLVEVNFETSSIWSIKYDEIVSNLSNFDAYSRSHCEELERKDLIRTAHKAALVHEYGKEEMVYSVNISGQEFAARIWVSKKTSAFFKRLQAAQAASPEDAVRVYLHTYIAQFLDQLVALPHFAAVFFNDCQLLTCFLYSKDPQFCSHHFLNLGMSILGIQLAKHKADIQAIIDDYAESEISGMTEFGSLKRTVHQCTHKIAQLGNVWKPILHFDLLDIVMAELAAMYLQWLWSVVCNSSRTKGHVGTEFRSWLTLFISEHVKCHGYCQKLKYHRCFDELGKLLSMSLLKCQIEFRRGQFLSVFTNEEFFNIISAFYQDSKVKTAFLKEIKDCF